MSKSRSFVRTGTGKVYLNPDQRQKLIALGGANKEFATKGQVKSLLKKRLPIPESSGSANQPLEIIRSPDSHLSESHSGQPVHTAQFV